MSDEKRTKRAVEFGINFPVNYVLTVSQIWPDGDAPENPTAADVVRQMKKTGGVSRVLMEWALGPDEIEVFGNHDASRAVFR